MHHPLCGVQLTMAGLGLFVAGRSLFFPAGAAFPTVDFSMFSDIFLPRFDGKKWLVTHSQSGM
jgi:hypothetical protein